MDNKAVALIDRMIADRSLSREEVSLLRELKAILAGERCDYVTEDMFQVFYEHAQLDELSVDALGEVMAAFYETRNLKERPKPDGGAGQA